MKTLVAVYSRTGNTLSVAKKIAKELDANLEIIRDKINRKGILGFLRSGYESVRKKIPPIVEPKYNPKDFNLVIIGTDLGRKHVQPCESLYSTLSWTLQEGGILCHLRRRRP